MFVFAVFVLKICEEASKATAPIIIINPNVMMTVAIVFLTISHLKNTCANLHLSFLSTEQVTQWAILHLFFHVWKRVFSFSKATIPQ